QRRTPYPHPAYTTCPPRGCPWERRCLRHTYHQFGNLRWLRPGPQSEDRSTDPANPDLRWMQLSCTSAVLQLGSCRHRSHVRAFSQRCMFPTQNHFRGLQVMHICFARAGITDQTTLCESTQIVLSIRIAETGRSLKVSQPVREILSNIQAILQCHAKVALGTSVALARCLLQPRP